MDEKQLVNDFEYITARLDNGLVSFAKIESEINIPNIIPNDSVAIRRSEGYKPGDFIFYVNSNDYFIRRIVKVEYEKVYVKGDNEDRVFLIRPLQVLGKVISIERNVKRISLVFTKSNLKINTHIRQGIKYIKDNLVEKDEYIIPDFEPVKKVKKEKTKVVLPLDNKLQVELQGFKTLEQKVEEFYNPVEE